VTTAAPTTSHTPSWLALVLFLLLCYAVAAIGAIFTAPSIPTWYAALVKPSFNPPNWIFAPVWTILYGLMAIAAWLIWRIPAVAPVTCHRRKALILFYIQLTLNFIWTRVFFSTHQLLAALIIIILLWIAIVITTIRFWPLNRLAGILMLPYLAWVTFAGLLNYELFHLN